MNVFYPIILEKEFKIWSLVLITFLAKPRAVLLIPMTGASSGLTNSFFLLTSCLVMLISGLMNWVFFWISGPMNWVFLLIICLIGDTILDNKDFLTPITLLTIIWKTKEWMFWQNIYVCPTLISGSLDWKSKLWESIFLLFIWEDLYVIWTDSRKHQN